MTGGFADHFSAQAADYARFRPHYPTELFDFLATASPARRLAWDCGTGSGQAAIGLAAHFERVHATDPSAGQLEHATRHERVTYSLGRESGSGLPGGSTDLVTAAQAAHWFDIERFHSECRRILAPRGVVALWTYGKFRVDPAVDAVVDHFYSDVVGRYWPPERRHVEQGYRSLPFPWHEESVPEFELTDDWDLEQVMGYLATWSAVQRCQDQSGRDPLRELQPRLAGLWPPGGTRRLRWPIHLRLGRA